MAVIAKARVAQLIVSPSITAAAEFPVTFGWRSYWLGTRLLGGRGKPLPYGFQESLPVLGRGAPWGSRRGLPKPRSYPHPPPSGAPPPWEGEGFRATARVAPTAIYDRERWLGNARRRGGTAAAAIFAEPGPSGPAGIQTSHSDFARREFCKIQQVRVSRNGVRGKANMSASALI